jgi:acyl-CoA reductase-like NAD-dependent aldehyde dehydrogenase
MQILNPATATFLAEVTADGHAAVRRKYNAARAAQPAWAALTMKARVDVLRAFREEIVKRKDTLAHTLTQEMGKPIRQAHNELTGVLGRIDFFLAECTRTLRDKTVHTDLPRKLEERISHEPLGVVANISAWNYPYFVGTNVFVPALLAGNAVLYKPSEFATLTGLAITDMLHTAGVPDDVFSVATGDGATGAAVARQPVDGIFFTGSHATGAKIAASAAPRMIKVQLELGGKDPVYVCDDAAVANAAVSIAHGAFYNTGQSCCSVERVYVHAAIYEAFVAAFVAEVKALRIGDPHDDANYIGPVTREAQLAVLRRQVLDATRKGARLLSGGDRMRRKGNWFAPTVLANVDHTMQVMREESFGPIIGIQQVADDAQAIALMNDCDYGLTAAVYSADGARARKILDQVQAGTVYWNCCDRVSPRLPWSGVKHSGIGLTLSTYGIETFTRPKAWHLRGQ